MFPSVILPPIVLCPLLKTLGGGSQLLFLRTANVHHGVAGSVFCVVLDTYPLPECGRKDAAFLRVPRTQHFSMNLSHPFVLLKSSVYFDFDPRRVLHLPLQCCFPNEDGRVHPFIRQGSQMAFNAGVMNSYRYLKNLIYVGEDVRK